VYAPVFDSKWLASQQSLTVAIQRRRSIRDYYQTKQKPTHNQVKQTSPAVQRSLSLPPHVFEEVTAEFATSNTHKRQEKQPQLQHSESTSTVRLDHYTGNNSSFSHQSVFYIKTIVWKGPLNNCTRKVRVVMENELIGPTPLIALCNALILRGDIEIMPVTLTSTTADYLIQILAERLLVTCSDISMDEVDDIVSLYIRMLPRLQIRQPLDPLLFTPRAFAADMNTASFLSLFEGFRIPVRHACCLPPITQEPDKWRILRNISFSDAKEIKELAEEHGDSAPQLHMDGQTAAEFLSIASHGHVMTKDGLTALSAGVRAGALCVLLYDENKFGTLYKHVNGDLYILAATSKDATLEHVVWRRLQDPIDDWQQLNGQFQPGKATTMDDEDEARRFIFRDDNAHKHATTKSKRTKLHKPKSPSPVIVIRTMPRRKIVSKKKKRPVPKTVATDDSKGTTLTWLSQLLKVFTRKRHTL
jgi:hypothetical protein